MMLPLQSLNFTGNLSILDKVQEANSQVPLQRFPGVKATLSKCSGVQRRAISSAALRGRSEEEKQESFGLFAPCSMPSGHSALPSFNSTNSFERFDKLERKSGAGKKSERLDARPGLQRVTQAKYKDISLGETISQCGFSVVHKASWKGTKVAAKVIVDPVITSDLK